MTDMFLSQSGHRLAYRKTEGRADLPTLVWLTGFNSDMQGGKVTTLEAHAKARGQGFVAFDYSGHGQSDGEFADGTVSGWRADSLSMIDELTVGPLVLIGSSMGGWMALLAALARPDRVMAIGLLAPAPDFTQKLMWPEFTAEQQSEIMETGVFMRPSDYGDPYPITRALIEDGKQWQIMDSEIPLDMPIRILQGMADPDVPWEHALDLESKLRTEDIVLSLIKDGDHRLSREQDIKRLLSMADELSALPQPE